MKKLFVFLFLLPLVSAEGLDFPSTFSGDTFPSEGCLTNDFVNRYVVRECGKLQFMNYAVGLMALVLFLSSCLMEYLRQKKIKHLLFVNRRLLEELEKARGEIPSA